MENFNDLNLSEHKAHVNCKGLLKTIFVFMRKLSSVRKRGAGASAQKGPGNFWDPPGF